MGKVMRHTLGASLNIRHNLSSSKGPKPLQLKLLTTYIPKTSAFTLADRKSGSAGMPRPISYAVFCLKKKKYAGPTTRTPAHRTPTRSHAPTPHPPRLLPLLAHPSPTYPL